MSEEPATTMLRVGDLARAFLLSGALVVPAVAEASGPAMTRIEAEHAEFGAKMERELQAIAPDAVPLLQQAQAARTIRAHVEALALYDRILEQAPGFHHALRHKCTIRADMGALDEALSLCRAALAASDSPENWIALARVLLQGEHVPVTDRDEALRLARKAAAAEPDSVTTQGLVAQVALTGHEMPMFLAAVQRLRQLAPDEMATLFFSAMALGMEGDLDGAEAELERARAAGLDPRAYDALRAGIADSRPFWHVPAQILKWGALAWIAVAALLFALGAVLSRVTLATARQLPMRGERTEGRALRRVYAAVLSACCVFYYLSLPLVVLAVLAVGGGILLVFLAIGLIPIKLTAIVAIVTLLTMAAVLKNMFVRAGDAEPGRRLDLAAHPSLRRLLDAVASRIDTRPVDSVYLTPDTTIAVTERGSMFKQLRGASERSLILGVGVLDGMKLGELSAILAHEYGHFSNRDTAGGGFALAVRRSLLHVAVGIARGGSASWWNPAWLFVNAFHRVFLRVSQGSSRLQEVLADRWAARAYGPELFERGLRHVIRRSIEFDARADLVLREVIETERPLVNLYSYRPAKQPELDVDTLVRRAIEAEPSPYDSHPRPADRIAWVQPIRATAELPADAEADCWGLFSDREQLERLMTAEIRMSVATHHGVEIKADEAAAAV